MSWTRSAYWLMLLAALVVAPALVNVLFRWLVAPIVLKWKSLPRCKPRYEPTRAEQLTPEVQEFVGAIVRQFIAEGFEVASNLVMIQDNHPTEFSTHPVDVLLVHRATGDLGELIAVITRFSRSLVFVVRSAFADGTSVVTGASAQVGVFPRDGAVEGVNFAWVGDAHTLCEAHRRRLARLGKAALPRVAPAPGTEIEHMERQWEREFSRVAAHGDYYLDPSSGGYQLTWKGAFLHAWKLTDPVKTWRTRLRDRRARRDWRALGMDSWRPPASAHAASVSAEAAPDVAALGAAASGQPHDDDAGLRYEAIVPRGEVRQQLVGNILTVRAGTPTAGQFLAQKWRSLIWLVFVTANMAVLLRILWATYVVTQQMQARGLRPMLGPRPPAWMVVWLFLAAVLFLADLYELVRGVMIARRGNLSVTASPAGLTYHNAPAWRGAGHIARSDLDGVVVVPHAIGLRGKTYQLEVRRRRGSRRLVLLVGPDAGLLERTADAIADAMGIRPATHPAEAG